jgi:hypothetical protein
MDCLADVRIDDVQVATNLSALLLLMVFVGM